MSFSFAFEGTTFFSHHLKPENLKAIKEAQKNEDQAAE